MLWWVESHLVKVTNSSSSPGESRSLICLDFQFFGVMLCRVSELDMMELSRDWLTALNLI